MKRAILAAYRLRTPAFYLAAVVLTGNLLIGKFGGVDEVGPARRILVFGALAVLVACPVLAVTVPRWIPNSPPRLADPPVTGRWVGVNSPATKIPSHGVRAYGQTYAIDIVADPLDSPRPQFPGPAMRRADEYPAFGEPVFAMLDGEVVRASGWRRDHRARSNAFGILYMMVEGVFRELGGPGFVVGNHVTIRHDDGTYASTVHLQRGSLTVRKGDRVRAGEPIGRCGNSGNSSEPHVHVQLMDRAGFWTAIGLPMSFRAITLDDDAEPVDALPKNDQHMTARPVAASTDTPRSGDD